MAVVRNRIWRPHVRQHIRRAIWERDKHKCAICRQPVTWEDLHVDHLTPWIKGGTHDLTNLRATHTLCNLRRGAGRSVVINIAEAARRLGKPDRTIRRWAVSGRLKAVRTADGWMVETADIDELMATTWRATRTVSPSTNGHVVADMSTSMTELVHLVDRLQRENRDLAGLVGQLQERNANLEQQLALPNPSETTPAAPTANGTIAPAQPSNEQPQRAPWWRRWLPA